jgi:hypothetical protein
MLESSETAAATGWFSRFLDNLDPGDRVGELLFGLIMVLTFTLGAGIELAGDEDATRELLIAALGCNTAWGIIDAALYLIGRLSERGRMLRLLRAIQTESSRERALALVDREVALRFPGFERPESRAQLDREVLARVRELKLPLVRVTLSDVWAGLAVFALVFFTALPAVVPFLFVRDPHVALRASNGVLIGLLFIVGWRWAIYTGANRWITGLFVTLLGVALVAVAIALGG